MHNTFSYWKWKGENVFAIKNMSTVLFLNILEDVSIDQCFYETLKINITTVSVKHEVWNIFVAFPILMIITSFLALPVSGCRGFILVLCNIHYLSPQVISYATNSPKKVLSINNIEKIISCTCWSQWQNISWVQKEQDYANSSYCWSLLQCWWSNSVKSTVDVKI